MSPFVIPISSSNVWEALAWGDKLFTEITEKAEFDFFRLFRKIFLKSVFLLQHNCKPLLSLWMRK